MKPKRRNAHAVNAWMRHGGAHDPGTKKPEPEFDVDKAIDDALEEAEDELLDIMFSGGGYLEVDGEILEIEFTWDDGEDDDETEE